MVLLFVILDDFVLEQKSTMNPLAMLAFLLRRRVELYEEFFHIEAALMIPFSGKRVQ